MTLPLGAVRRGDQEGLSVRSSRARLERDHGASDALSVGLYNSQTISLLDALRRADKTLNNDAS